MTVSALIWECARSRHSAVTSEEVVGEVLCSIRQCDASWQQEGVDVDAQHGQHDHKGGQQGCALAGGDDRARDPVIQTTLQRITQTLAKAEVVHPAQTA